MCRCQNLRLSHGKIHGRRPSNSLASEYSTLNFSTRAWPDTSHLLTAPAATGRVPSHASKSPSCVPMARTARPILPLKRGISKLPDVQRGQGVDGKGAARQQTARAVRQHSIGRRRADLSRMLDDLKPQRAGTGEHSTIVEGRTASSCRARRRWPGLSQARCSARQCRTLAAQPGVRRRSLLFWYIASLPERARCSALRPE